MTSKSTTKSPSLKLTERDYRILADIALCGGLTAEQIGVQHFNPTVIKVYKGPISEEVREVERLEVVIHANCQKRLKLLRENGFLRRIEIYQRLKEGKKPYLYVLTRLGADAVATHLNCTVEQTGWRHSETRLRPNYVEHHARINDVRLAVIRAVDNRQDITLERWYDEVELTKRHSTFTVPVQLGATAEAVKLLPDACFVLRGPDGKLRYHFVEVDRGTETTISRNDLYRTFATKMLSYKAFIFTSKGTQSLFQQVYGARTARVLTITTNAARRQRLVDVSESIGAERVFWFTTHPQITTPSIVPYRRKTIKDGEEIEVEAYHAFLPDILSSPMWLLAKDGDPARPEHALDEPFKRIMQQ